MATCITSVSHIQHLSFVASTEKMQNTISNLRTFITDPTLGNLSTEGEQNICPEEHYRLTVFNAIMERLINEMERRYGRWRQHYISLLITSIISCHPHANNVLDMEVILPLVQAYNIHKTGSLSSQFEVRKLLIKRSVKSNDIPELRAIHCIQVMAFLIYEVCCNFI
jgi:hypothetical protein